MPKHGTSKEHNTHTHTSYDRLNVQCTKQLQQFVVVARSSTWSTAQDCSTTVTTTDTNSKKQSPTVSVYPLRYAIWSGNAFEGTKFSFSTCLLWTLRNIIHIIKWIRRNTFHSHWILRYTANLQLTLSNTVHGIFDVYCSILSTEHSLFLRLHNKKQLHQSDTTHCAHLQC